MNSRFQWQNPALSPWVTEEENWGKEGMYLYIFVHIVASLTDTILDFFFSEN